MLLPLKNVKMFERPSIKPMCNAMASPTVFIMGTQIAYPCLLLPGLYTTCYLPLQLNINVSWSRLCQYCKTNTPHGCMVFIYAIQCYWPWQSQGTLPLMSNNHTWWTPFYLTFIPPTEKTPKKKKKKKKKEEKSII